MQALADESNAGQQDTSRHLGLLHQSDVLAAPPRGSTVWYRLEDPAAFELIEQTGSDVLERLRELGGDST